MIMTIIEIIVALWLLGILMSCFIEFTEWLDSLTTDRKPAKKVVPEAQTKKRYPGSVY